VSIRHIAQECPDLSNSDPMKLEKKLQRDMPGEIAAV
jgi:hypothetical protein